MAVCGLCCCAEATLAAVRASFDLVSGLLTVVASPCGAQALGAPGSVVIATPAFSRTGSNSCRRTGLVALGPAGSFPIRTELISAALADGLFTTEPPRGPPYMFCNLAISLLENNAFCIFPTDKWPPSDVSTSRKASSWMHLPKSIPKARIVGAGKSSKTIRIPLLRCQVS